MPNLPETSPKLGNNQDSAIICGDCRQSLGPDSPAASAQVAASNESVDWYCPRCALPTRRWRECPECRSVICPDCGAALELADELGIG